MSAPRPRRALPVPLSRAAGEGRGEGLIEDLLRRGHAVRFVAGGTSMAPTIRDGAAVLVAPAAPEALERGEIALYAAGERLFAHRIVGTWTDAGGVRWFCLRGDNRERCDPPVPASAVLGRVVGTGRRLA